MTPTAAPPVVVAGQIDRIDGLPSGMVGASVLRLRGIELHILTDNLGSSPQVRAPKPFAEAKQIG